MKVKGVNLWRVVLALFGVVFLIHVVTKFKNPALVRRSNFKLIFRH